MNVKESYYNFLRENKVTEIIPRIISEGVEKAKKLQAFEFHPGRSLDNPKDWSGNITSIPGKTIGDISNNDIEVLNSYTGEKEATFESCCGWHYRTIKDNLDDTLNDFFFKIRKNFVTVHKQELQEHYAIKHNNNQNDLISDILEAMSDDDLFNLYFFSENFPQYEEIDFYIFD